MRILFVINNAPFFVSHRLPIAAHATLSGHEVAVISGRALNADEDAKAITAIERSGTTHFHADFSSASVNPFREILGIFDLICTMRKWRPDVVHCVTQKGMLYGGIAAHFAKPNAMVFALAGAGSLFLESAGLRSRILAKVVIALRRFALFHSTKCVITQNKNDAEAALSQGLAKSHELLLIPGSGVNLPQFIHLPIDGREKLVVLPARMLRDKGVVEFVEAAKKLKHRFPLWRFALVGAPDHGNPTSISEAQLVEWRIAGDVEWWGHHSNMSAVFAQAAVVCLPSYREGMPKALLEAAAAGCAVLASDAVGCKDAIVPGVTGELITVRDADALADGLARMLSQPDRLRAYGSAGREHAISHFGIEKVISQTIEVYQKLTTRQFR